MPLLRGPLLEPRGFNRMCVIFPKERLFVVTCRPFTKYLYIRVKTEDYLTYFLTYSFRRIPWTMATEIFVTSGTLLADVKTAVWAPRETLTLP